MMVNKKYNELCNIPSDINEHLPTLKKYAEECNIIVEMGVRSMVSTFALLAANPKKLTSLDLYYPSKWGASNVLNQVIEDTQKNNIDFSFVIANTLEYQIDECDLLFIDTLHQYNQLKQELMIHSNKVAKYIIMHDTTKNEFIDEITGNKGGLWPAIEEFLQDHSEWVLEKRYTNNNGLTILKRL